MQGTLAASRVRGSTITPATSPSRWTPGTRPAQGGSRRMPVDQTSLDRIRNATFPSSRRGYDKHEVEKFLARLADWLETGAGDESRSDTVKRELERVGERTGAILAQAEETRAEADKYAGEKRISADSYAQQTREAAEQEVASTRQQAEQDARETIE